MIRPYAILLIGLILCLGAMEGCSTASTSSQQLLKVAAPLPPAASNADDPTPPMPDREVVHFDIESFNGDVMIEADPKAKEMSVSWLRESKHGANRGSEARAALSDITADVQTVDDEHGRTIVIRITTTNPEPHFLRANLSIKAPAVGDVRIRTSRGKVYVSDSQGEAFIETTEGDVRLMTHWPVHTPMTILNARETSTTGSVQNPPADSTAAASATRSFLQAALRPLDHERTRHHA